MCFRQQAASNESSSMKAVRQLNGRPPDTWKQKLMKKFSAARTDYLKSRNSRLLFIIQFKVSRSFERFKERDIHEREDAAYFKVMFNFPVFHFAVTANYKWDASRFVLY